MKEITKYLPRGWESKAREMGAFTRGRNIKTEEELLALNMLYISNGGSFQMTSSAMKLNRGISVNKNAVYQRIKASGDWLRWMGEELCRSQGASIEKPDFLSGRNVILVDASDEALKGDTTSAWRLHYAFDLFAFECRSMELTKVEEGEKLARYEVRANDIFVADRVYGTISSLEHVRNGGGNYLVRLRNKAFRLYDEQRGAIDLLARLRHLKPLESMDVLCSYKDADKNFRPVRIVAMKKDAKAIESTRKKLQRKYSKKQQKTVSSDTLEFNDYIVLATSLEYTNEQILELYRARWQVEKVFFRLKSLFGYGDVPSKKDETVRAWFYGKLFLAALCESIMKQASFSPELDLFIVHFVASKLVE